MTTSTIDQEAVTSRDMRRREPKMTQAEKDRLERLVARREAALAKAKESENELYEYLGKLFVERGVSILEMSSQEGTPSRAYIYRNLQKRGIDTSRG